MATFKIEYTYYVGDIVNFTVNGNIKRGIVQCVSQIPDIWVECVEDGEYKKYCIGIDSLELIYSEHKDSGTSSDTSIKRKEHLEFVHGGVLGTPEFNKITYIK